MATRDEPRLHIKVPQSILTYCRRDTLEAGGASVPPLCFVGTSISQLCEGCVAGYRTAHPGQLEELETGKGPTDELIPEAELHDPDTIGVPAMTADELVDLVDRGRPNLTVPHDRIDEASTPTRPEVAPHLRDIPDVVDKIAGRMPFAETDRDEVVAWLTMPHRPEDYLGSHGELMLARAAELLRDGPAPPLPPDPAPKNPGGTSPSDLDPSAPSSSGAPLGTPRDAGGAPGPGGLRPGGEGAGPSEKTDAEGPRIKGRAEMLPDATRDEIERAEWAFRICAPGVTAHDMEPDVILLIIKRAENDGAVARLSAAQAYEFGADLMEIAAREILSREGPPALFELIRGMMDRSIGRLISEHERERRDGS